jgi:hypothetical protein
MRIINWAVFVNNINNIIYKARNDCWRSAHKCLFISNYFGFSSLRSLSATCLKENYLLTKYALISNLLSYV